MYYLLYKMIYLLSSGECGEGRCERSLAILYSKQNGAFRVLCNTFPQVFNISDIVPFLRI